MYVLVRTQVINQDDLENVKTIQAGYKVEPIVPSGREDNITFPVPPCNPQSSEDPEHPGNPNMDIENFFTCAVTKNFVRLKIIILGQKISETFCPLLKFFVRSLNIAINARDRELCLTVILTKMP